MVYSLIRFVSILAMSWALSTPAGAQALAADDTAYYAYGLHYLVAAIGLVFAGYYAHNSFAAPIATPEDGPAPPRYMTQPNQYRMGMTAYIGSCLAAYVLIVVYYKDVAPLLELAAPLQFRQLIDDTIKQSSMSFPAVVVLGVVALVTLLRIEQEWNPLFAFRRLVWRWVSIPELVNQTTAAARDNLVVPLDARLDVANDSKNHVDVIDFDKDRQSVDRNWAELCYVRLWLTRNLEQGSHFTFFNEPSFAWKALEGDYEAMRQKITPVKRAPKPEDPFGREVFDTVAQKVDTLRRKYCRLAACFMVFKNANTKGTISDAVVFGAKIANNASRANPMRYIVLFVVAILASIYLGVWLSATFWDLLHPAAAAAMSSADEATDAVATRWVYYGLASFGAPIIVALILRYLAWSCDAKQPDSYPISYATIFAVSLVVSVVSLALITKLAHGRYAGMQFVDLLFRDFKWGWSPALICVYVVYHIDRQIDPLLPDVGKLGGEGILHRMLACFSFAIFVTFLSALPAASLEARPGSAWPVEKLHAVVIGTIFTVGFVMALVSQFCLVKPANPRAGLGAGMAATAFRPFSQRT